MALFDEIGPQSQFFTKPIFGDASWLRKKNGEQTVFGKVVGAALPALGSVVGSAIGQAEAGGQLGNSLNFALQERDRKKNFGFSSFDDEVAAQNQQGLAFGNTITQVGAAVADIQKNIATQFISPGAGSIPGIGSGTSPFIPFQSQGASNLLQQSPFIDNTQWELNPMNPNVFYGKDGGTVKKKKPNGHPSAEKAAKILKDGEVHGKPLSDKQRRFFAAYASGKGVKGYADGGKTERKQDLLHNPGHLLSSSRKGILNGVNPSAGETFYSLDYISKSPSIKEPNPGDISNEAYVDKRSYYRPDTHAMHLFSNDDYMAELSHAYQYKNKGSNIFGPFTESNASTQKEYDRSYNTPGTNEYQAHKQIEPFFNDLRYNDTRLSAGPESNAKYNQIIDNQKKRIYKDILHPQNAEYLNKVMSGEFKNKPLPDIVDNNKPNTTKPTDDSYVREWELFIEHADDKYRDRLKGKTLSEKKYIIEGYIEDNRNKLFDSNTLADKGLQYHLYTTGDVKKVFAEGGKPDKALSDYLIANRQRGGLTDAIYDTYIIKNEPVVPVEPGKSAIINDTISPNNAGNIRLTGNKSDDLNVLLDMIARPETGGLKNPYGTVNKFGYAGKWQVGSQLMDQFGIDRNRFLSDPQYQTDSTKRALSWVYDEALKRRGKTDRPLAQLVGTAWGKGVGGLDRVIASNAWSTDKIGGLTADQYFSRMNNYKNGGKASTGNDAFYKKGDTTEDLYMIDKTSGELVGEMRYAERIFDQEATKKMDALFKKGDTQNLGKFVAKEMATHQDLSNEKVMKFFDGGFVDGKIYKKGNHTYVYNKKLNRLINADDINTVKVAPEQYFLNAANENTKDYSVVDPKTLPAKQAETVASRINTSDILNVIGLRGVNTLINGTPSASSTGSTGTPTSVAGMPQLTDLLGGKKSGNGKSSGSGSSAGSLPANADVKTVQGFLNNWLKQQYTVTDKGSLPKSLNRDAKGNVYDRTGRSIADSLLQEDGKFGDKTASAIQAWNIAHPDAQIRFSKNNKGNYVINELPSGNLSSLGKVSSITPDNTVNPLTLPDVNFTMPAGLNGAPANTDASLVDQVFGNQANANRIGGNLVNAVQAGIAGYEASRPLPTYQFPQEYQDYVSQLKSEANMGFTPAQQGQFEQQLDNSRLAAYGQILSGSGGGGTQGAVLGALGNINQNEQNALTNFAVQGDALRQNRQNRYGQVVMQNQQFDYNQFLNNYNQAAQYRNQASQNIAANMQNIESRNNYYAMYGDPNSPYNRLMSGQIENQNLQNQYMQNLSKQPLFDASLQAQSQNGITQTDLDRFLNLFNK